MYTIKQISEKMKINANAIRFYEKKELIKPKRSENGYRMFDIEEISRLEMIILYRKMGFTIESIKKMLDAGGDDVFSNQFYTQYELLNEHIHSMIKVREALGQCVELLLNKETNLTSLIPVMEETAHIIAMSNQWEDKWNFNDWASDYDKDIRKESNGLDFYGNYDTVISKTADSIKGNKIVEIGIGTGNLASEILKRGILPENYIGIDQSVAMLKQANNKCPEIELRIGTFLQLPLVDRVCDTIVTSYAFHHCNSKEKELAIMEMDRVLWGKGRIVITDLMFKNEEKRAEYEKTCNTQQRYDLQDEFFADIEEMQQIFSTYSYRCKAEQIDELIWILIADKK